MFIATWLWIAAAAGAGALLRWRLSIWLNPIFPALSLCEQLGYGRRDDRSPDSFGMSPVGVSP